MKKIITYLLLFLLLVESAYAYYLYQTLQTKKLRITQTEKATSNKVKKTVQEKRNQEEQTNIVMNKSLKILSNKYDKPLEEIIEEYEQKVQENPKDKDSHYELARIYKRIPEKRPEAIYHLEQIAKIDLAYAKSKKISNQIKILQLMNKNKKAKKEFIDKAYDLWRDRRKNWGNKKIGAHFYDLAKQDQKRNFFSAAEINYRKALRFDPKNEEYHFEYAQMVINRAPKTSIFHFEKILTLNPESIYRSKTHKHLSKLKSK